MRGLTGISILPLLMWGLIGTAAADEPPARIYVLVSPTVPLRPAFVESLRIQLADVGSVEEGIALADAALTDRVARAAELVERNGATMAVWMERAGADELILFAVSRHRERALVQVIKLPAASESEIDRLVALKIGELTEAGASEAGRATLSDATTSSTIAPKAVAATTTDSIDRDWLVEIGIDGSTSSGSTGSQVGARFSTGVRWDLDRLDIEAVLTLRAGSALAASSPSGQVTVDERDGSLGGRILAGRGRLSGGLRVDAGLRRLAAQGISSDGRTGTTVALAPMILIGLDGRWRVRSALEVRAGMGIEVTPQRPVFSLDGMPTADIGRLRPMATFSIVIVP